jgi:tetratricopeptide (TPR) repeat protein
MKRFVLIAVAIAAIYGQTTRYEFVTYDDYDLVFQNGEFLSNVSNVGTAFTAQVFASRHAESVYYRPVLMASFILDYHLWGLDPAGYHLVNVIFHIVTALFVFLLVEKLARNRRAATLAGLLFALHPLQTESVAWIAGRNDVLLGLFVVLMIYWYVSSSGEAHGSRYAFPLSVLFFGLALFTKEAAAFYLLLLPLYDLCVGGVAFKKLFSRRYLVRYAAMGAVLACYLAIRLAIFGDVVGAEKLYGSTPLLRRLGEVPAIVTEYCRLLVVPVRLSIAHPLNQLLWLRESWSWVAWLVVAGLPALLWWTWRRDRLACFGLLWFVVGLLPTLDIIPVPVPILEHRMYVPLAGVALALVRLLLPASDREVVTLPWKLAPALPIGILAALSVMRLPVWHNSETLWLDTIEKAPAYSRSYFNLAGYYFNQGKFAETIPLLKTYVQLKPNEFLGYSKLRETYYLTGQYGEAAQVCRDLIARTPHNPDRYIETAELFVNLRMRDSAVAVCRAGLEFDSSLYQLHDCLGALYLGTDSTDVSDSLSAAEHEYRRSLELNPGDPTAHFGLGKVFSLRHETLQAIGSIEEGIRHGDPPREVVRLLASLYAASGQEDKARELLERFNF